MESQMMKSDAVPVIFSWDMVHAVAFMITVAAIVNGNGIISSKEYCALNRLNCPAQSKKQKLGEIAVIYALACFILHSVGKIVEWKQKISSTI